MLFYMFFLISFVAGSSGQADSGVGELYAVVDKSKKGAAKKAKKETTKGIY